MHLVQYVQYFNTFNTMTPLSYWYPRHTTCHDISIARQQLKKLRKSHFRVL